MTPKQAQHEIASPLDAPQAASAQPRGAAGDEAGGVFSNTPPSNPHSSTSARSSGGEDWLELSLYVDHKRFAALSTVLNASKQAAEEGNSPRDELKFGGQVFFCLPHTATTGSKNKRIAYRWVLECTEGYELLLMNRQRPHKTMPNAIFRATSLPLLRHGTKGCWQMALRALQAMGTEVCRNKVARVDPCVDLGGVTVAPLFDAYQSGHYLTRARYSVEYLVEDLFTGYRINRRPTGFTIGRGQILLRVYDKILESDSDLEKLWLLIERRWGEQVLQATRVEFQLRRQKLKKLGIDDLEDWFCKRAAVTEYLTYQWVYLTDGPINAKHSERNQLLPLWSDVQQQFAQWCGQSENITLAPLPKQPANVDHLVKQWVGLSLTILANLKRPIDSQEDFTQELLYLLTEAIEDRDMCEEFRRRVLELKVGR